MTLMKFAEKYYEMLLAKKSEEEAKRIAESINSLTYENGELITDDDKEKILKEIYRLCQEPKRINGHLILEYASNEELLKLCALVHTMVKNTKKQGA